jgi:hypothetical protein
MTTTHTPNTPTITHPITGITEPAIVLPASRIANMIEVLDHCDLFLRTSSRDVARELADYCLAQPSLTSGWLIDMIGFAGLRLRTDLEEAGQPKPSRPQPARPQAQR